MCGVALGYGGLVAVVVRDMRYVWTLFTELGITCSFYDEEQHTVTLFYQVSDRCPPNMDFVSVGDPNQCKYVITSNQGESADLSEMQPVLTLMAQGYYMELNDPQMTSEPIGRLSAATLLHGLSSMSDPLLWAQTRRLEGAETNKWKFINEALTKYGKGWRRTQA